MSPHERLLGRLALVKAIGERRWQARCPAHDDRTPSLTVSEKSDGGLLVHCHAGCNTADVLAAVGLEWSDLFAERPNAYEPEAVYGYVDEHDRALFEVVRFPDKRFRQRRPDGQWGLDGARRVLYGLPRVREAADRGERVYVVEGEKDVAAVERAGGVATCNPGGAGKWRDEYAEALRGAQAVVVADRDVPGRKHAADVARSLEGVAAGVAAGVAVVEPAVGKDVSDHLAAGKSLGQLVPVADGYRRAEGVLAALPAVEEPSRNGSGPEEAHDPSGNRAIGQHLPPDEAWRRCAVLAREPRILERLCADLPLVGLVGEDKSAQLLYLVTTSRLLEQPVSAVVKGPSSGGKSYSVETVLGFFPDNAFYTLSGGSERALAYSQEPLEHRVLVIYEAAGMGGDYATYLLRSLLSEGRLRYETVEKTSKGMRARLIEREGPTGLIITTTQVNLHPENETRLLSIPVNDTPEQTRNVLLTLADDDPELGPDLAPWHALQDWLAGGERRVVIPFARRLAELIAPVAVRLRRDFSNVLGLVRAHALLHRATRGVDDQGRIIATGEDYALVRELVLGLVSAGVGATVRPETREAVNAVAALTADHPEGVPQAAIAEAIKLDRGALSRRIRVALDGGYLVNLEERRGRPHRLVLGDPLPDDVEILPPVEDCCTVARLHEGLSDEPSFAAVPLAEQPATPEEEAELERVLGEWVETCTCGDALVMPDALGAERCTWCGKSPARA